MIFTRFKHINVYACTNFLTFNFKCVRVLFSYIRSILYKKTPILRLTKFQDILSFKKIAFKSGTVIPSAAFSTQV